MDKSINLAIKYLKICPGSLFRKIPDNKEEIHQCNKTDIYKIVVKHSDLSNYMYIFVQHICLSVKII